MVSVDPTIVTTMNQNANAIPKDSRLALNVTGSPVNPPSSQTIWHKVLFLGHCAGVSTPLPEEIVRGAIFARIKVLTSGITGCRGVVAEKTGQTLNQNITPVDTITRIGWRSR